MYIFGIVVPDSDETPAGRAAAALRLQLPASRVEQSCSLQNIRLSSDAVNSLTRSQN
jgi:hypothetical protein